MQLPICGPFHGDREECVPLNDSKGNAKRYSVHMISCVDASSSPDNWSRSSQMRTGASLSSLSPSYGLRFNQQEAHSSKLLSKVLRILVRTEHTGQELDGAVTIHSSVDRVSFNTAAW